MPVTHACLLTPHPAAGTWYAWRRWATERPLPAALRWPGPELLLAVLLAAPLSYAAGQAIGHEQLAGLDDVASDGGTPAGVAVLLLLVSPVGVLLGLLGSMAARLEQPKQLQVSCAVRAAQCLPCSIVYMAAMMVPASLMMSCLSVRCACMVTEQSLSVLTTVCGTPCLIVRSPCWSSAPGGLPLSWPTARCLPSGGSWLRWQSGREQGRSRAMPLLAGQTAAGRRGLLACGVLCWAAGWAAPRCTAATAA